MNRATLIRAAEIIEREASVLHASYTRLLDKHGTRGWDDDVFHREHDEMLAIAGELREEAA